ncbi:hypothetical protein PGT21_022472 [Puccinia graminis f. sp. tritici]|uniref:Uncharacterized protein n=1 Tax=Puccinia graminis f. sp. tritici TaxID=56615 RepID=A0A5B0LY89_PUCGR|nr:hypothetical protein PGT21_022472 [Puccinia graminis f. sp. tritici]KAA1075480.1 hypothetical protein PGTUg99_014446 [Puccinia graminis f. sp. tritici]
MRLRLCCAARYRPAAKPKPVRAEKSARPGRRGIAYCRSMDAGELGAMPCCTPTIHSHYRMGGRERRSVPVSPGTLSRRPLSQLASPRATVSLPPKEAV